MSQLIPPKRRRIRNNKVKLDRICYVNKRQSLAEEKKHNAEMIDKVIEYIFENKK